MRGDAADLFDGPPWPTTLPRPPARQVPVSAGFGISAASALLLAASTLLPWYLLPGGGSGDYPWDGFGLRPWSWVLFPNGWRPAGREFGFVILGLAVLVGLVAGFVAVLSSYPSMPKTLWAFLPTALASVLLVCVGVELMARPLGVQPAFLDYGGYIAGVLAGVTWLSAVWAYRRVRRVQTDSP